MPVKIKDIKGCSEKWKSIRGFEEYYEVSDKGNVRSLSRKVIHKNGRIHYYYSQKIKPFISCGYRRVGLTIKRYKKHFFIHELVSIAFIGNRPNGLQINHKDAIKTNNIVENLEYLTRKQNAQHAVKKGLYKGNRRESKYTDIICGWCKKIFRPYKQNMKCCSKKCAAKFWRNDYAKNN